MCDPILDIESGYVPPNQEQFHIDIAHAIANLPDPVYIAAISRKLNTTSPVVSLALRRILAHGRPVDGLLIKKYSTKKQNPACYFTATSVEVINETNSNISDSVMITKNINSDA